MTDTSRPSLTLTASLRPAAFDARRSVVRLDTEVLTALGLRAGAPVALTARRSTAGIAALAEAGASRAGAHHDHALLAAVRRRRRPGGRQPGDEVVDPGRSVQPGRDLVVAGLGAAYMPWAAGDRPRCRGTARVRR